MSDAVNEVKDQLETRRVYTGRVLNLDVDTVRYPNGASGELEMIRHPGASAVLPIVSADDTADPQLLLIRQYRYAAGGPIWEIPAGRLEAGESPEECARRELLEEAGASARRWRRLTTIFTTPGFTDEQIHLFAASDLMVKPESQRREPDEFIELKALPISQVLSMIRDGELVDGKTAVAVLFFAGFHLKL